ncbi:MAG TPA: VWA domain-containing protein [Bryobacteraceae bacterium]|nr:VWA domain-containing protein [Bryobacteraceae bacterium]
MWTSDKIHRTFKASAISALAVLLAAVPLRARTPDNDEKPRSVDVTVQGVAPGLLKQDNFRLLVDNKPVAFQLVPPETRTSILFLVEDSQYSRWMLSKDLATAILGLLDASPKGTWFGLATYSDRLKLDDDLTQNKERIVSALRNLPQPVWPEVETFDAVYKALDELELIPGRRALVVIGSGYDRSSEHTADEIQSKIEESHTLVYSIGIGSRLRGDYEPYLRYDRRMRFAQDELFLRLIAQDSGGMSWFPKNEDAFRDAARQLELALKNQYRLVYFAKVTGRHEFHPIRIEALEGTGSQRREIDVRARKGWRY